MWVFTLSREIPRFSKCVMNMQLITDHWFDHCLKKLDLPTLVYHRERGDMIEVWKHFNSYDKTTLPSNFRRNTRNIRNHPHLYQLTWNRPNDGVRGVQSNSFYFRTATKWNNLPASVVQEEDVDKFKAELNRTWMSHPQKYRGLISGALW